MECHKSPVPRSFNKSRSHLDVISLLVRLKIDRIHAVVHDILSDPLVFVLLSLSGNSNDFRGFNEVHLNPLVSVSVLRLPTSAEAPLTADV